ncbi:alcohol dehydrogenase catalytic domain-containing protein [Aeromicrobium duanguangcaii]|uniref:alcohol dehydrogenase catalytic domain-containing protein n=1 Tax=Aeromicrobium duanguangcaii TaxID=2968086 RepID=UPI002017B4D5|nr:zinc-binding dehydrogenase [Aeromicrobium duanguangcaii]MCL3836672.1 zinc-binding dehydrogenase [Aeromicrobium duanguangcaii]
MHAIRHHDFGPADILRLETLPDLVPGEGQVRIRVDAVGVHLLDTSIRAGDAFGAGDRPALPMIPGREVAGVVDDVGAGVDGSWLGRSVVAHLGFASGGYAEQAVVDSHRAHLVPAGLDAATAVATIGTGRTATAILELAELKPQDVVVVTSAAGGLGPLLLQGAATAGARTVGLAGGPDKTALVARFGATLALDHQRPDWQLPLREVGTPTVVLDGVAGPIGRALYRSLAPGGRLVRFGWSSGEPNDYDDPSRPVIDVLGPTILDRLDEFERAALRAAADGTRVPHVGTVLPLSEAAAAHRALESRASVGKVVLLVPR